VRQSKGGHYSQHEFYTRGEGGGSPDSAGRGHSSPKFYTALWRKSQKGRGAERKGGTNVQQKGVLGFLTLGVKTTDWTSTKKTKPGNGKDSG